MESSLLGHQNWEKLPQHIRTAKKTDHFKSQMKTHSSSLEFNQYLNWTSWLSIFNLNNSNCFPYLYIYWTYLVRCDSFSVCGFVFLSVLTSAVIWSASLFILRDTNKQVHLMIKKKLNNILKGKSLKSIWKGHSGLSVL